MNIYDPDDADMVRAFEAGLPIFLVPADTPPAVEQPEPGNWRNAGWVDCGYTTEARAFARVGPDGLISLDAPLVEVDPESLLRGLYASIRP